MLMLANINIAVYGLSFLVVTDGCNLIISLNIRRAFQYAFILEPPGGSYINSEEEAVLRQTLNHRDPTEIITASYQKY